MSVASNCVSLLSLAPTQQTLIVIAANNKGRDSLLLPSINSFLLIHAVSPDYYTFKSYFIYLSSLLLFNHFNFLFFSSLLGFFNRHINDHLSHAKLLKVSHVNRTPSQSQNADLAQIAHNTDKSAQHFKSSSHFCLCPLFPPSPLIHPSYAFPFTSHTIQG